MNRRSFFAFKPDQAEVLGILTLKGPIDENPRDMLSNLQKRGNQGGGRAVRALEKRHLKYPQLLSDGEVPLAFTLGAPKSVYMLPVMRHLPLFLTTHVVSHSSNH